MSKTFTAEEKLEFLKSKGLHVTTAKTSDKPEPYLVYVIDEESEFDDTSAVIKLTDAEIELKKYKDFHDYVEEKMLMKLSFDGPKWGVPTKKLFDALCDAFIRMKAEINELRSSVTTRNSSRSKTKGI